MGSTITEKILARASGRTAVKPGEIVTVDVDWCMSNDATTHISIDIFNNKVNRKVINDPKRTIFILDHNIPSESVKTTQVQNKMRRFAREHGIILHDGEGVCHQILLEKYIRQGQVVIGADSHTCSAGALGAFGSGVGSTDFVSAMVTGKIWLKVPQTIRFDLSGNLPSGVYARDLILKILGDIKADGANYMAMEYGGPAMKNFTIDDRIVLCNLSVEGGAKNGIIETDDTAIAYFNETNRGEPGMQPLKSDSDCSYEKRLGYDLAKIEPGIAAPHFVDNYDTAANKEKENIKIHQGFIGSCSNGRIEELRVAAKILGKRKIRDDVKLIVSPASNMVYLQAIGEGLAKIFMEAGAMVVNPNCSVCWGACQGVIGDGEVLISTGTRNFKGRSGSPNSFVYLASAATVAASCIEGIITDPRKYIS